MGKENPPTLKERACRACTDFKSWTKGNRHQQKSTTSSSSTGAEGTINHGNSTVDMPPLGDDCPLDKDSLGRYSWAYLHTMAAYFPETPTPREQKEMSAFMKIFAKFYPCDHCARDLREEIKECPPNTTTRYAFSQWMCQMHNIVNKKLGKEEFDCKLVDERWRDGWKSGECD